jgi:general secretion pathway protein K
MAIRSALRVGRLQRGVALVAVLWVVAALSILVTGLVQTQREEIRTASSAHIRQQADAIGQGAIELVVQGMVMQPAAHARLARTRVSYDGVDMVVEAQPLAGLVDLNLAPEPLLAALFTVNGALDKGTAARLAASLVAMRLARPAAGPAPRFQAPEELLGVEGVDYDLYARLAHLVTTDSRGTGRINPLAAPQEVLLLLARGDRALASRIAADRDADVPGMDTTRLEAAFTDTSVSSRFRFRAFVPFPDGAQVTVVRDLDISPVTEGTVPWRTMRAHRPVMSPKPGRSS